MKTKFRFSQKVAGAPGTFYEGFCGTVHEVFGKSPIVYAVIFNKEGIGLQHLTEDEIISEDWTLPRKRRWFEKLIR